MNLEQFLPAGLQVAGDELIAMARQTRADVVLGKPFDLDDVEELLERFLGPPSPALA